MKNRWASKRYLFLLIFILLLCAIIVIFFCSRLKTKELKPDNLVSPDSAQDVISNDTINDIPNDTSSSSPIDPSADPSVASDPYLVTNVVDGDTLDLQLLASAKDSASASDSFRVRLIGVDSPETVHPEKPVECYGPEASNYLKTLAEGKTVYLELDPSQGDLDKYGRTLAYLYLDPGSVSSSETNPNLAQKSQETPESDLPSLTFQINYLLLSGGFAREYTYNLPYKYQAAFRSAELSAQSSSLGLWGACEN